MDIYKYYMGGGLIQIASYGKHDSYLIGKPEITFFKMVYKKHTNFSMEYLEQKLDGMCDFGSTNSCTISKIGDLVHKIYLKIELPQINLLKIIDNDVLIYNQEYNLLVNNYNLLQNFINIINYSIVQPLYLLLKINNLLYNDIITKYNLLFNSIDYSQLLYSIVDINITFPNIVYLPLSNNNVSNNKFSYLLMDFDTYFKNNITLYSLDFNTVLKKLLDNYTSQISIIKTNICNIIIEKQKINNIKNRQNICFAWAEYIGHQIIDKIEIEIGGKIIDFIDNIRLQIYYQLTNNILLDDTYNKLIGNIDELKTFNSDIKPSYTLYIPINFWFSKYSGTSLPLIFLRYHDVKINIKLNDLINCCYYEKIDDNVVIENLISLNYVSLLINYIYLDSEERKKFGQISHEYLIDQTQVINYNIYNTSYTNIEIPFFNPIKQLFWLIRNNDTIEKLKYFDFSNNYYIDIYQFLDFKNNQIIINTVNINLNNIIKIGDTITIINSIYYSGSYTVLNIINEYIYINFNYFITENYIYNYNTDYSKNNNYIPNSQAFIIKINNNSSIQFSTFEINGITRFNLLDSIYTNYVQPYQSNSKSPSLGLNSYSFALYPENYQPSGFCNFNKINLKTLSLKYSNIINSAQLSIYAHSYNILLFEYGKAGLVLNL